MWFREFGILFKKLLSHSPLIQFTIRISFPLSSQHLGSHVLPHDLFVVMASRVSSTSLQPLQPANYSISPDFNPMEQFCAVIADGLSLISHVDSNMAINGLSRTTNLDNSDLVSVIPRSPAEVVTSCQTYHPKYMSAQVILLLNIMISISLQRHRGTDHTAYLWLTLECSRSCLPRSCECSQPILDVSRFSIRADV